MENTTKRAIVEGIKGVTGVVGGFSAGYVVDGIVKNLLPAPAKPWAKVAVVIGQSFLSSALADAGVNSVCENIDAVADILIKDKEESLDLVGAAAVRVVDERTAEFIERLEGKDTDADKE